MPRPPETFSFTWRDVACRVEHIRDWRIDGWSRLVIKVVHPRGAPLPFTENGYHVHELDEDNVAAAGGVVTYLIAWMDRDAVHSRYAIALARWKQGDLFR
ncbi:conserved hypothetical protein [Hyphomicrobium sp. GJ21]|uniref:hypothetical protein n=1 Tax=Hyphomicrobium sp. GJ21 TaxID=113574 RepID=UPI000622B4FC|nr:hypothetical protein [Hyphomicrobium sp. GJ21]CEJ87877.1 conserved hypothetical protein [Hyphomicrobium sp. GJ21]